ncbi:hypothetical protein P872_03100 [Rhodonellum psychrophilum GCM71 = DSM 17998]|uniref:DUF11 domain-containing protein n=2 Tax=Rhodonellum TaxID=336827 RepID=U5C3X4_9BACT|nr:MULTISPECIES: gliding motility-associated C-terminal domain-containing protein [Rhodonellum]ERM83626.1 hypothetical protein P872_03100 [Rhodonellum psychrophilum GCM71 = DSM 17998]SDY50072.1 conserved repeat domain-containing protein/gliding motility-associated C-terminal domain-containing protein [Rhodonellum ikkaensis]
MMKNIYLDVNFKANDKTSFFSKSTPGLLLLLFMFIFSTHSLSAQAVNEQSNTHTSSNCQNPTRIEGMVFIENTGKSLKGIPVLLVPQDGVSGGVQMQVTNAEGKYYFMNMAAGKYLLQIGDANLNHSKALYAVESNMFIAEIKSCDHQTKNFGYSNTSQSVIGNFVWYDFNGNGIQDEWFDANEDGKITQNIPDQNGYVDFENWEWIDLNGDGSYEGTENIGELNKAGLGNQKSANIFITGPNGYSREVEIDYLGHYIDQPTESGEYQVRLEMDAHLSAASEKMGFSGKVKIIPNFGKRILAMEEEDGPIIDCGPTKESLFAIQLSARELVRFDIDFGIRCQERPPVKEILANDIDLGEFDRSYGGLLGNILSNVLFDGNTANPKEVDFEFTDLDDVIGLLLNEKGEISLIPEMNEARKYRLTYVLREAGNPDNQKVAFVTFSLKNDQSDLSVILTSNKVELWEGDVFEYQIEISNDGALKATGVAITNYLPAGVTYLSSSVLENKSNIELSNPSFAGNKITWKAVGFPTDAKLILAVKVKSNPLNGTNVRTTTNLVEVSAAETDVNPHNNVAELVNVIHPFFIPNVITPNGDNKNDRFEIRGIETFVSNKIKIFNRFGDNVFERTAYANNWDATGQAEGTYYYELVSVDNQGGIHEFKGWVQVVKEK